MRDKFRPLRKSLHDSNYLANFKSFRMKHILHAILVALTPMFVMAQSLPSQWNLDEVNHRLTLGGQPDNGLYNPDVIKEYYLEFDQSNYWTLLTNAYGSENYIEATLTVDGVVYPQVGVAFKGQTSYMMAQGEDKKSFSIVTDAFVSGQNLEGYNNFNLNNCFDDPSFMKEFFLYYLIDKHIPAARCTYVKLYINGESWGLYPSVQQLNKDFLEEWYLSNDGTNWRADAPAGTGGGGGGGPQWGDGTAAFNYLGDLASDYDSYYTLKTTTQSDPWAPLIQTCDILNNSSNTELPNLLPAVLDIDRTLWFLAIENAFADDDSYIYKGKMDYFCYWELETGRMVPQEYDGNSILADNHLSWSPFYHADDVDYPLLNKLLNIPIWRQRYLAHMRTIAEDFLNTNTTADLLNYYSEIIDPYVQDDDKKLYSYAQFTTGVSDLIDAVTTRRNTIMANTEVNTVGAAIADVNMISAAGVWVNPIEGEQALVTAAVSSPDGIFAVNLYHSNALVGNFAMMAMNDAGTNGDAIAGDGIYSAFLPALTAGELIRFYIEAVENNTAKTVAYNPTGAEHDVYYAAVAPSYASSTDVVINELLADNLVDATDESSEHEDWIELYNKGLAAVDLSGYHMSDNQLDLTKWEIPSGTILAPDNYLIIWADEDSAQGPLHANFKLSWSGETVTLLNAAGQIADEVAYGQQETDLGYARSPNGTGGFVIQQSTFGYNNNNISVEDVSASMAWSMYPNPSQTELTLVLDATQSHSDVIICDLSGREVYREATAGRKYVFISTAEIADGAYVLLLQHKTGVEAARLIVRH
jgi:CotH kinase protein/Lamin Tail Domain/Secretion system C-terminal sorting domain